MITLEPDVFYIRPVFKNILLLILAGVYLSFIQNGVPFQILGVFFILPFGFIFLLPTEQGVRKIIFGDSSIQVNDFRFSYEDLVHSQVHVEHSKYGETKGIGIDLQFVVEDVAHWFHATLTEENKEKKHALVASINQLINNHPKKEFQRTKILKEKQTDGRYFLIALSVAFGVIFSIWGFAQFSALNVYDGNELNPYFWVPLLGGVILYSLQYYLLVRTSSPHFKLSSSASNRLHLQHKVMALLVAGIGYFTTLQGLYWVNRHLGTQENLTRVVKVESVEMRRGKGCSLSIHVYHPGLLRSLELNDECKRFKNYFVGKEFELKFHRGSLGGYYFE